MAKRAWPNRDGDWATKVAYREFSEKCLKFVEGHGQRPVGPNKEHLSDKVILLAAGDALIAADEAAMAAAEAAETQEDAKGN